MTYSLIARDIIRVLDEHSVGWTYLNDGLYAWEESYTRDPDTNQVIDTSKWVKVKLTQEWLNRFLGY